MLVQAARVTGLDRLLRAGLALCRLPGAVHDPGKIVLDLAVSVALGGDCAADIAVVRAQPGLFGPVASDSTVSRLIARLAADAERAQAAIRMARAAARERVWRQVGPPRQAGLSGQVERVVLDLDATLVTAHSDKESAAPTWKGGFGFHPLLAFADHGAGGTGEPVAELLRPGNAGSNTAADHVLVLEQALAQLPEQLRQRDEQGRVAVLVRTDAAGATQEFTRHIAEAGMEFSVGAYLHQFDIETVLRQIPKKGAWTPAYNPEGRPRDGAWVAEVTDLAYLSAWPQGTRLILRKERPHPGAQLRFTDVDGLRVTGFLTNTTGGQLADLELRHRHHARVEDRIRAAKDTGLRNLPFPRPRPEPDLAPDHRSRPRPPRLDPTPRADRVGPESRTQTPTPARLQRRRPARPHQPPPPTQDHQRLALDRHDPHRTPPAHRSRRSLTPATSPPSHRHRPPTKKPNPPAPAGNAPCTHLTTTQQDQHIKITKDRG